MRRVRERGQGSRVSYRASIRTVMDTAHSHTLRSRGAVDAPPAPALTDPIVPTVVPGAASILEQGLKAGV